MKLTICCLGFGLISGGVGSIGCLIQYAIEIALATGAFVLCTNEARSTYKSCLAANNCVKKSPSIVQIRETVAL